MSLTLFPTRMSIKVELDDQVGEIEVEGVVAEQTGLAYIMPCSEGENPHLTLVHMPTRASVGYNWGTSVEQEAKEWISILHEVIDWTEDIPRIRPGKLAKVLNLVAIGAVHEVKSEDAL